MSTSAFGGAIAFMDQVGIFDTVLPFLLVFTLIFAFLEKTKVLGMEDYKTASGKTVKMTRKNLNSMIAFVIGFFVVASTQLVALISELTAKIVLVILLVFSFLLTVGSFHKETDESFYLQKPWSTVFQVIAFLAIGLIFLDSLGWLNLVIDFISGTWNNEATASLVLIAVIVGFIFFITWDKKPKHDHEDKKKD